jgi:hypothetical protein
MNKIKLAVVDKYFSNKVGICRLVVKYGFTHGVYWFCGDLEMTTIPGKISGLYTIQSQYTICMGV